MTGQGYGRHLPAALEEFVYREAALLDAGRFEEWAALFSDDGYYWVPMTPDQPDPLGHVSLIYDSAAILRVRARRLRHEATVTQWPPMRTSHHVTNLLHVGTAGAEEHLRGLLLHVEARRDEQRIFSGMVEYALIASGEDYRIRRKKVTLLNCDQDSGHLRLSIPF